MAAFDQSGIQLSPKRDAWPKSLAPYFYRIFWLYSKLALAELCRTLSRNPTLAAHDEV